MKFAIELVLVMACIYVLRFLSIEFAASLLQEGGLFEDNWAAWPNYRLDKWCTISSALVVAVGYYALIVRPSLKSSLTEAEASE